MFSKTLVTLARRFALTNQPIYKFAKPPAKDAKQQQPVAPEPVQLTKQQLVRNYLTPLHPTLSPSEQEYFENGFGDLSGQQRKYIDKIADHILQLDTGSFLALERWGGLGTQPAYYIATQELSDQEIKQDIRALRKQN